LGRLVGNSLYPVVSPGVEAVTPMRNDRMKSSTIRLLKYSILMPMEQYWQSRITTFRSYVSRDYSHFAAVRRITG
jgi:hypothetical protein